VSTEGEILAQVISE